MREARKHILIADTDEEILINLERILQDEGYETATAWSTEQVLKLVESTNVDLILVSEHPPELSCKQVLSFLQHGTANPPCIVMQSAVRHPFAEQHLLSMGAKATVNKWRNHEVIDAVRSHVTPGTARNETKRAVAG